MQLTRWLVPALLIATASHARADGELSLRGAYYKERATRVIQPMLDALMAVDEEGSELRLHTLVDSITSASVASGASGSPFTETRYEFGGDYLHRVGIFGVGGGVRFSSEPDYKSLFLTLRGRAELARRNTILDVTLSRGNDDVSNESAQGSGLMEPIRGELATTLGSLSLTQALSPLMVGALTYDLIHLSGYQENPYRTVSAGGVAVAERVPDVRWRHAVFGSLRRYVPPTRTVLFAGYRFYADDWGVVGHTPELRVIQEITPSLFVHLRARYYRQSGADFYKELYDSADPEAEPFLTDDAKLGPMTTQTYGLKLELGLDLLGFGGAIGRTRTEALVEYLVQDTHFGDAVSAQAAVVVPFE